MSAEGKEEFFVGIGKLALMTVPDTLRRLEELFEVRITVSTTGQAEGEWVTVTGKGESPKRAKEYIQALCNPECVREERFSPERLALCHNLTEELEKEFLVCVSYKKDFVRLQGSEVTVIMALSKIQELVGVDRQPNGVDMGSHTEPEADRETWVARSASHPERSNGKIEQKVKEFIALGFEEDAIRSVIERAGPQLSHDELMTKLFQMKKTCPPNSFQEPPALLARTPTAPELSSPPPLVNVDSGLRPVIIDGSNVAMSHGKGDVFSCEGIRIVVNSFRQRGHTEVIAVVPAWRKEHKPDNRIKDQHILSELEQAGCLCYTPSRKIDKKRITPYDDNFIVQSAHEKGGVIVSNDNYRDIMAAHPEWKETIEQRLLMYMFMGDLFMLAEDPAGKNGPHVDNILRVSSVKPPSGAPMKKVCPHGRKCTFGNRCRFYHPNKECPNGRSCKFGAKCRFYHPENDEGPTASADEGKTANTPSAAALPDTPIVTVTTSTYPSEVAYYPGYTQPRPLTLTPEHLAQVQGRSPMAAASPMPSPMHYRVNAMTPYQSSPSVTSPYSLEQDSTRLVRNLPPQPYVSHTFPQYHRTHPRQNLTTFSNPGQPYYSSPGIANNGEMLHLMSPMYQRDRGSHVQHQLYEMLSSILKGKDDVIRQVLRENPHLTEQDLAVLVRLCQDRC